MVLAWGENGLRHVTANKPVRSPSDLKGLKIRAPQSDMIVSGLRALGADPAPLSFRLLPDALRTGEFQAEENPIAIIEAAQLYKVQKCVSLTGHVYDALGFVVSSDLMEDLTPLQRTALAACAQKGAEVSRQVAESAQSMGIARLRSAGMLVVDDVDVAAFRVAARPFLQNLASSFDPGQVNALIRAGM